jgi:hypothetical protein
MIGQTTAAEVKRTTVERRQWEERSFFDELLRSAVLTRPAWLARSSNGRSQKCRVSHGARAGSMAHSLEPERLRLNARPALPFTVLNGLSLDALIGVVAAVTEVHVSAAVQEVVSGKSLEIVISTLPH